MWFGSQERRGCLGPTELNPPTASQGSFPNQQAANVYTEQPARACIDLALCHLLASSVGSQHVHTTCSWDEETANKQAVSRSDTDGSLGASWYLVPRLGLESSVHLALVRLTSVPGGGRLFSDPILETLPPSARWNLFIIYSCSGRSARTPPAWLPLLLVQGACLR